MRKKTLLIVSFFVMTIPCLASNEISVPDKEAKYEKVLKEQPLTTVLRQLEKAFQTQIVFSYDDLAHYKVNCSIKAQNVEEALRQLLKGLPLNYVKRSGSYVIKTSSQNKPTQTSATRNVVTVSGTVVDEKGDAIPGATIKFKSTGNVASISDANGHFILAMEKDKPETLVVTFLGMEETAYFLNGQKNVDNVTIRLRDDRQTLGEVVVTGIFNKSRESYTGAASTFTHKQLQEAGNRSLATALKNLDPSFNIADNIEIGSDPNNLPGITIRGASSLPTDVQDMQVSAENQRTANQPLFILDGFEITLTRFMDLDESQVESITLLKDANATALYGSKGSNGVVVITSKRIGEGKLRFSYKGTLSIEAPDLTSYNLMNAAEKLEYERLAELYTSPNPNMERELLDIYNSRKLDVERGVNTYWLKFPVRTGIGSRHNASVEGGNENLRYGASIGYNNIEGAMKGSNRNTLNGEMYLLYKYKNWTFQNRLQILNNKSKNSPYGSFSQYCSLNPYYIPYNEDGTINKVLDNTRSSIVYNPLYDATLPGKDTSEYTDITNNFSAEWNITPDFFVRGQFSFTKQTSRSDKFISPSNTAFNDYQGDDYKRKGRYIYGTGDAFSYSGQLTFNYSKTFAEKHQIFAGLGATIDEDKSESYSVTGEGISVENMDFLGMASQYLKDGSPSGSESISRNVGLVFNARYTYDQRYFLDLNGKYEGSSQFGSNNHFAPFWSTGAGWNIHNEKFMQDQNVVNVARVRVSYGITGSQNFASYLGIRSYHDYSGQSTSGWYGVYLMAYGNPDLKWQTTNQFNVGADLELLDRRIVISGDLYNKVTDDLLSDVNLPISSGFSSYKANIGKVQNRGWELSISGQILRDMKNDFRWTVGFKAAHNSNKIKEISNSLKALNEQLESQNNYTPSFLYKEGESMNTIYAVQSKGIDPSNGKEVFIKADGTETY
ncbi:MAG: SusC/RagA family TonB-linked outer membrane protein, partial [Prevotella sp.]